jgi:hypothetical protein
MTWWWNRRELDALGPEFGPLIVQEFASGTPSRGEQLLAARLILC